MLNKDLICIKLATVRELSLMSSEFLTYVLTSYRPCRYCSYDGLEAESISLWNST